jgi:hypothetical protein
MNVQCRERSTCRMPATAAADSDSQSFTGSYLTSNASMWLAKSGTNILLNEPRLLENKLSARLLMPNLWSGTPAAITPQSGGPTNRTVPTLMTARSPCLQPAFTQPSISRALALESAGRQGSVDRTGKAQTGTGKASDAPQKRNH